MYIEFNELTIRERSEVYLWAAVLDKLYDTQPIIDFNNETISIGSDATRMTLNTDIVKPPHNVIRGSYIWSCGVEITVAHVIKGDVYDIDIECDSNEPLLVPYKRPTIIVKPLGLLVGNTFKVDGDKYLVVDNKTIRDPDNLETLFNGDIKFCTTEVTDMRYLFYRNTEFNLPIGDWDVSNVTDMHHMFYTATNFNQDISNWNVSSVTNMRCMFGFAKSFNQDISKWNMKNVVDDTDMFEDCNIKDEYKPKIK